MTLPGRIEHLIDARHFALAAEKHREKSVIPSRRRDLGISRARTESAIASIDRALLKPIAYTLQFRGRAESAGRDRLRFTLTAPSSALVTTLAADGVRSTFEDVEGGDATFEAELSLLEHSNFEDVGTIDFGRGNTVRFHSVGQGRLIACPDPNLRHGTVVREVERGNGQFANAEGLITSNFLLSDTGEVTENHLGLIFVDDRRFEPDGKGAT
jgi:hypothetical protein